MKRAVVGVVGSIVLGSFAQAGIYSMVGDNGLVAIDLVTGATKVIPAAALGLQEGDDIDAISLGDDTRIFNKTRFDIFAVNRGAHGSAGDLQARAAYGLPVSADIYIESRTKHNRVLHKNLAGGNSIDAFDLGDIVDFAKNEILVKPIFFSLAPNSPTLASLGASAGDVLVVVPNQPSSLKVFVQAADIGNPTDIDALSMSITDVSKGYDPVNDYIIYSTAGSADIYHYGYRAPLGNKPHSPSEFGLGAKDTIEALEHKRVICYDNCIHLLAGWQMFGFSQSIEDVQKLFANQSDAVVSVWAYDVNASSWKFYSPDANLTTYATNLPNITMLHTLGENEGFWVLGKKEAEICPPSSEENQSAPSFPTTALYSFGPTMQVARMMHWIVPMMDGSMEVIGGHGTGFKALNSMERFDSATQSFVDLKTMRASHDIGAMARLADGRYLIAGGAGDLGVAPGNDVVEIFDPHTGSISYSGKMVQGRTGNVAVDLGGEVLIVGGWYDNASTAIPELYDVESGTSVATAPLQVARSYPWVLPTDDGKAVVFWGYPPFGGSSVYDSVELYNPQENNFTMLSETMLGEKGWRPLVTRLNRPIDMQRMDDGKYLLWGVREGEVSLITFDPVTKKFEKFVTNPALPSVTQKVIFDVLVDNPRKRAILLALKAGATPQVLSVYIVDLQTKELYAIANEYTLPSDFFVFYSANAILQDGSIFITGGNAQGGSQTNFSAVNKTLLIELR